MNAHTPPPASDAPTLDALAIAATNESVLRALLPGPIAGDAAVAKAAGVPQKNVGRTLKALKDRGLVERLNGSPMGWEITRAGRTALLAIDVAQGRADPALAPVAAEDPNDDPDALLLAHDQLRPNPLQPRKLDLGHADDEAPTADRLALDQLKASIVAAGGLLQNLVVFPADPDGVHTISAGERRWRAVGELIEEGLWPADRRLRALQREATAGQVSFVALVENGQREPLTLIQQARAYAALTAETGWSARHAALQTGRDPRTVQEMLRVLEKAAPADIARHETDPRGFTWEELRETVREARAPADPEPVQADLEDLARDPDVEWFSEAVRAAALAEARKQPGHERDMSAKLSGVTTIEGESWPELPAETIQTPWPLTEYPRANIDLMNSDRGRWGVSLSTQAGGPGFSGQGQPPYIYTSDPIFRTRAAALRHAANRIVHQLGEVWGHKRKLQAWLAEIQAETPAIASPIPPPMGEGDREAGEGASPIDLTPQERLALAELAHKLLAQPEHEGWTRVRRYWLHGSFQALKDHGLVAVSHKLDGGPHAQLTTAGENQSQALGVALNGGGLTLLRQRAGMTREADAYATPWLNETQDDAAGSSPPPPGEGDREAGEGADLAPTHDDLDDQEETTAAILLDDVRATLDRAHTAAEVQDLLRRAGFKRPFEAGGGDNAGGVFDAAEEEVATVDVNRATPDAQAQAIAKLLAYGLNLASGPPGDTRPRAPIDAAPVERLVAAAEQIRQLLLSGVDPASGLFAAIEQRYADFDAAISATRRAIAASQPQNLA